MKRKKSFLLGLIYFMLLGVLPVTNGLTDTYMIYPGSLAEPYFDPNEFYNGLQGSYSANASIDVFITDINRVLLDENYYMINNSIPDSVLWRKANASSGSFAVSFPDNSIRYYIVFGNRNGGNYVSVQYTVFVFCGECPTNILVSIIFILVAIIGLMGMLQYRRRSKN